MEVGRVVSSPDSDNALARERAEDTLREAGVKWHTFDLDAVRKQADGAFIKCTKVKDGMLKRLGAE